MSITFKTNFVNAIPQKELINKYFEKIIQIFQSLQEKTADGVEMTGWLTWIFKDHTELFTSIKKLRDKWIKANVKTVVVIGTGGSYVGAKGILNFVNDEYKNKHFEFIFVPSFAERSLASLLAKLQNEKFAIVVISKSGTTLESSISFRLLRELLFKKESNSYHEYIVAVTDKEKGVLKKLAVDNNFQTFTIQDDIGGRYSTLTAVGLVPMILSGIDGEDVIQGAQDAYNDTYHCDLSKNTAALYAAYRHYFFEERGLKMECIASYDPQLGFTLEKMKQLFAESEGKNDKGLMPVLLNFTPDLHSVGQLLQDGPKNFFETIVLVKEEKHNLFITKSQFNNDDGLDWLCGKTLKNINDCAFLGTIDAHSNVGQINNLIIELDSWSAKSFGYFYFWACLSAMFSAYLFSVNPFDQPGVESYKKRMFDLLKK